MSKIRRVPIGVWVGWTALAISLLWLLLGLLLFTDPLLEQVYFTRDESTGWLVAQSSPLGLYSTDELMTIRSDTALLRPGFTTDAFLVVGFTALGAMLLDRNPRNLAGWLCAAMVVIPIGDVIWLIGGSDSNGMAALSWLLFPVGLLTTTILLLILPDGRLPHRLWWPVVGLMIAWIALRSILRILPGAPQFFPYPPGADQNSAVFAVLGVLAENFFIIQLLALAGVIHRIVLTRGPRRAEAVWIFVGATIYVFGDLIVNSIYGGIPGLGASGMSEPVGRAVTIVTGLALPLACAIGVLRYRGPDRGRLAVRVLDYCVLGIVVTGCYLALNISVDSESFPGGNVLRVTMVAEPVRMTVTAVTVAMLSPLLHRWLQGGVKRLVYGRRGSPDDQLAALSHRLADAAGPDEVLAALADAVLMLAPGSGVRVVLTSGGRDLRVVTRGMVISGPGIAGPDVLPLVFQGVELGRIETSGVPQDAVTRSLLADLGAGAAAALAAARRSAELQLVREQLVAAREQERRRIARDLHDGVGPVLSGLGFTLDALRATIHDSPEAERVAGVARDQVRQAGQLVRRVANQLRPAGVDQLGLLGALREISAWHSSSTLTVDFDAPDLGELSAATEMAAYAIVAEAITNVARHAQARHCRVALSREPDAVVVTVRDDGIGMDGAAAGLGRGSMIERAEELGGTCAIRTHPGGGTIVSATLPAVEPVADLPLGAGAGTVR